MTNDILHMFNANLHTDSNDNSVTMNAADLDAIVSHYNAHTDEAPKNFPSPYSQQGDIPPADFSNSFRLVTNRLGGCFNDW